MRFIRNFKLVELCLKVIVDNLLFYVHNKTIPQNHIDFLHRLYSEEVFQEYCNLNTISEDCMIWFLNPRSKKITLSIITEKICKQLQIIGTTITSLNLKLSLASENILNSIICCVPHLKYLDLNSTSCSNKTLLLLQRMCPELSFLNLNECQDVSTQGMINLCDGCNLSLNYLDITDTRVDFDGLRHILTGMPTLTCLKFFNLGDSLCFAHKHEYVTNTFENIQYNLTELIYEGVTMCDNPVTVIFMWTVMCPKVKTVHFLCPVNNEILHACTGFQQLEEVRIKPMYNQAYMKTKDAITPLLPVANTLKTLILSYVNIPIVTLIENFVNLKCLFLSNVQFTTFKDDEIKTTETKLDTLIIKDNNFKISATATKAIALLLSLSKNVTNLKLNYTCPASEKLLHILLNSMKKLTFVDLSYSNVKTSSVMHFFEIPSVRRIYLDLCNGSFSIDQQLALKNIHVHSSPCTLSWRIMASNPDDSDSDILSEG